MLCSAVAGTHTSAGQRPRLLAGFLVPLVRKQLSKPGGLLGSAGVTGLLNKQLLESFYEERAVLFVICTLPAPLRVGEGEARTFKSEQHQ